MTTPSVVEAAPAPTPSEPPVGGTTPLDPQAGGRSEAMIVVAVLAEHAGNQGCIRYLPDNMVAAMVEHFLARHSHRYALEWRARVAPTEWGVRWDCAREIAAELYPTLPGVTAVPDVYLAYDGARPSAGM